MFSPAWPHDEISEIFPNIFFVMGTNITQHDNVDLQHSRNMIIIRNDRKLSLINTVRLSDRELAQLDRLGEVVNIIRIGAFYGRDDAFYLDRYRAKLWALKGMQHAGNRLADVELSQGSQMPFPDSSIFIFETSVHPEGIIHIAQEGGIIITCDSIKNWTEADQFFSATTAKLYEENGTFGTGTISGIWKQATQTEAADFNKLKTLKFRHLLGAHGRPLLNNAHEVVSKTIMQEYGARL